MSDYELSVLWIYVLQSISDLYKKLFTTKNRKKWDSGRNFDFCYGNGFKIQPLIEINRVTAPVLPLNGGEKRESDVCKSFFVEDRNRVNSQVGVSIVPDHHLARLPDAVVSHIVPGLSTSKSFVVYADPQPILGRTISDKDEIRNLPLSRAVNTQVRALSVAKKPALTIFQRKLTAGIDHRHSPIRHSQCIRRIHDAAGLVGN
jgi:hypothetical protein